MRPPAPARPPRAPASRMPTSAADPNATQATNAQDRSTAAHITTRAHTTQSRTLIRHVLCSCTITDQMNAPTKHQRSTHTHARRRVQPALPVLGTQEMHKDCPAHCSNRFWLYWSTFTSKSPAVAVEDEHTDASRSAAANAPAPAAALAAPAQRSHARSEQRAAALSTRLPVSPVWPRVLHRYDATHKVLR